jgi:hypothetical protein
MQTKKTGSHPHPVLTQANANSTHWVGHLKTDPNDHFAGQTFTCPAEGQLDNIQLYSSAVHNGGEVVLTLHEFDTGSRHWGPALGSSTVEVRKQDHAKWLRFELPHVPLHKGGNYGFRIQASNAMVGLGEAATGNHSPFTFGHEWSADSRNQQGQFYSYFSLAFKVELCA